MTCLLVLLLSSPPTPADQSVVARLEQLVQKGEGDGDDETVGHVAIIAGEAAVPKLRSLLRSSDEEVKYRAATALAYIGGDAAVAALKQEYRAKREIGVKALLAAAMPSASKPDRRFLIDSLSGEHFGDEWPPIVSAAFSLGILRAREAEAALRQTAKKTTDSIASHAAEEALSWLRSTSDRTVLRASTGDAEQAVAAVLANGVPRIHESEVYYDPDRKGQWRYSAGTWTFDPNVSTGDLPHLTFRVFLSPDKQKALVSVGLTFGSLNGVGYDYVLHKTRGRWFPQALFFTWIS